VALTPQLAQIKAAVAKEFASEIAAGNLVTRGGVFNCRPMRPQPHGITWIAYSEHAWSNAWDLYYGDRPRKYVDAVVRWLKREKRAGRLPVGSIIRYGRRGSHVHIEGAPKRNPRPFKNIPPCAGGAATQLPNEENPEMIKDIQESLNDAEFTDYEGRALKLDGEWGPRTASAFDKMTVAAKSSQNAGITTGDAVTIKGTIRFTPER